jgi:hypothetical protein
VLFKSEVEKAGWPISISKIDSCPICDNIKTPLTAEPGYWKVYLEDMFFWILIVLTFLSLARYFKNKPA